MPVATFWCGFWLNIFVNLARATRAPKSGYENTIAFRHVLLRMMTLLLLPGECDRLPSWYTRCILFLATPLYLSFPSLSSLSLMKTKHEGYNKACSPPPKMLRNASIDLSCPLTLGGLSPSASARLASGYWSCQWGRREGGREGESTRKRTRARTHTCSRNRHLQGPMLRAHAFLARRHQET